MQCSCGGSTKTENFFRVRKMNRKTGEVISLPEHLEVQVCVGCGRVGRQFLWVEKSPGNEILVLKRS